MKKIILILIINFCTVFSLFSQNVEKLIKTEDIKLKIRHLNTMPAGIMVDEKNQCIYLINGASGGAWIYNYSSQLIEFDKSIKIVNGLVRYGLNDFLISNFDTGLFINNGNEEIVNLNNQISAGISFILKKGKGYIVFYVDEAGVPGAADTDGKIYTNYEAYDFLEQYDKEKYEQSLKRASALGLYNDFMNRNVLIWGETYFSSIKNISCVYGENPYIRTMDLIQYDQMGYGYEFYEYLRDSKICIVSPQGKRFDLLPVVSASNILSEYTWAQDRSFSWYVGFGGNIYYYIAGEEYTEVFRIRRTWGNSDFYAMAINGYTEDEYGEYVKKELSKLNKKDLRLLRNTIFAIYGVHFKSEDLAKYFDKQVWYTDEGKTSGEVTLPPHRQKLVEMIQALEK